MKTTIYILFAITVIVTISGTVMAQPPGLPAVPPQAPIDGGLGLLAAAGGAYALKKLRDKRRNEEGSD